MKLIKFLNESNSNGTGADGLSKARLKTMINKATKKCTYNKLYNDSYWQGPQCVWDAFDKLNLNWHITKSEYKNNKDDAKMGIKMPSRKEWHFEIMWDNNKGKHQKMSGYLTAAGAGTVEDPLSKYDLVLIIW